MGLVREAEQIALGRTVAIKTIKPGRADPAAAGDLLREAWITGALEHPNIVPVHHLEIDDDLRPLLILKRIDGVEWSALCRDAAEVQRRFGATDLLAWNLGILNQVLNAVRFAHSRGVIHRDLKPGNVMIGNFGEVYLLDWGIAVSVRDDGTGRFPLASEATELAGTPSYMAPEMLGRGTGVGISERTDVYLAGAVLFELITGHPPHVGTSALAVIASVVTSRPVLPTDVPAELAQICAQAMHADPARRHASIDALQLALQGYLEHRGSARLSAGAAARLEALVTVAARRDPGEREELYRLLAICRFAFHEALAVWRGNAEARAGVTRATIAVAEFELACGAPRAALMLLTELPEPPALLDEARAAAATQAARQQELEALGRDADPTLHARTRLVVLGLGGLFTVLPALSGLLPSARMTSSSNQVIWGALWLVVITGISLVMRGTSMTSINRRLFAAGQFLFLAQTLLATGGWLLAVPATQIQVINMFMWGTLMGTLGLSIDRWLAVPSLTYYAAFLFAARFPETRMYAMSLGNLVFTAFAAWRWRPAVARLESTTPPPPVRRRRDRP